MLGLEKLFYPLSCLSCDTFPVLFFSANFYGFFLVDKNTKYSEVTARESLANMRKRQEEEAKEQALRDASDSTYATVDYDLVKVTFKLLSI